MPKREPLILDWDMLFALIGAMLAQLLLERLHDRQISRITQVTSNGRTLPPRAADPKLAS